MAGIHWQVSRRSRAPGPEIHELSTGFPTALVALGWNNVDLVRSAINLGGRLDWRTIWWPILPLSIIGVVLGGSDVVRDVRARR